MKILRFFHCMASIDDDMMNCQEDENPAFVHCMAVIDDDLNCKEDENPAFVCCMSGIQQSINRLQSFTGLIMPIQMLNS